MDEEDPDPTPEGPRPLTAMAATGWALGSTFLFFVLVVTLAALRPGSEHDVVSAVACQAMAYLLALFLILRVHGPEAGVRDFVGMRPTQPLLYPLGVALGLAMVIPSNALYVVIDARWPSHTEDTITEAFTSSSSPMRAAMALSIILFGPMLEELLFRGALFRPMLKVHPPSMVIAVTAVLFALVHLAPQSWLPIALLGLALGLVRRASGSLVPSMLAHGSFNAVSFYAMAAKTDLPRTRGIVLAACAVTALLLALVHLVGQRSESARTAQDFDLK